MGGLYCHKEKELKFTKTKVLNFKLLKKCPIICYNRALTQVNESYTDTAPIEPSYSSLGPNYDTATTNDEGIDDYNVLDHNRPKPKPFNPPPVKVEASKREDEFFNTKAHMYTAVNKKKKKHATMVGGE